MTSDGETGKPGEGMQAESAPHARPGHGGGQDCIIGRVIDPVRDTGDRHHRQKAPETIPETNHQESQGFQRETADQDPARPEPVHQIAKRQLRARRGTAEHGHDQAKLKEADAELLAKRREQRRQEQDEQMTEEMRDADQANHLEIGERTAFRRHGMRFGSHFRFQADGQIRPTNWNAPDGRSSMPSRPKRDYCCASHQREIRFPESSVLSNSLSSSSRTRRHRSASPP